MSLISELREKWENYVNSYLFANFKTLEYWVAKREVSEHNMIFNYIRFPKAENGKIANVEFIKFIVQSIEADETECKKIFGPGYKFGTAEIQDDINDISIIWNKLSLNELLNLDFNDQHDRQFLVDYYKWDINAQNNFKRENSLSPEEIKRREKIDKILRLMSKQLHDPKLAPENRHPKDLEKVYNEYDWEKSEYWNKI